MPLDVTLQLGGAGEDPSAVSAAQRPVVFRTQPGGGGGGGAVVRGGTWGQERDGHSRALRPTATAHATAWLLPFCPSIKCSTQIQSQEHLNDEDSLKVTYYKIGLF